MSLIEMATVERDTAEKDLDDTQAGLVHALVERDRINGRIAELRAAAKFYESRLGAAQRRLDSLQAKVVS